MTKQKYDEMSCGGVFAQNKDRDYFIKPQQVGPYKDQLINIFTGAAINYEDVGECTLHYGSEVMW